VKLAYLFGSALMLLGLVVFAGPMILPRSFFGELGHGDGFGLVGLVMQGGMMVGAGVIVLTIAAVVEARRGGGAQESGSQDEE